VKVGSVVAIFITVLMILAMSLTTPGYCVQTQEQKPVVGQPAIDTGIPTVTPDQFIDKFKRIVLGIHDLAVNISPYLTLLIVIVGGVLGVIIKSARVAVFWAVIAMLVILWGPQLVGLFEYFKTI